MITDFLGFISSTNAAWVIVVLVSVTAIFLLLEICTPSFGFFGAVAILALIAAIITGFHINSAAGFGLILGSLLITPVYLYLLVKLLPKTPVGKLLFLKKAPDSTAAGAPKSAEFETLVGKEGVAVTLLRPAGTVKIDSKRYPARSVLSTIQVGQRVRVIKSAGVDIVVELIENSDDAEKSAVPEK